MRPLLSGSQAASPPDLGTAVTEDDVPGFSGFTTVAGFLLVLKGAD